MTKSGRSLLDGAYTPVDGVKTLNKGYSESKFIPASADYKAAVAATGVKGQSGYNAGSAQVGTAAIQAGANVYFGDGANAINLTSLDALKGNQWSAAAGGYSRDQLDALAQAQGYNPYQNWFQRTF